MGKHAVSIIVSEDERAFIDGQIASGRYLDAEELLRAGIAELRRKSLTPGNAYAEGFSEAGESMTYDVDGLRRDLAASLASGVSARQVGDIMDDVKAKLRVNGAL